MGMTKYDRLLYILNLLRSRKTLNAARLAEECGVTERSIYRDIISLSEANVPIYYDNGYKLASDNFLPPLNFTIEEYACLRSALESTPLAFSRRNSALLKQIKAKVEAGLSDVTREKKRTVSNATHIDIAVSQASERAETYFAQLEQAVADQIAIEIDYETIEHGTTTRVVEPYFIVFRGHAFYFVAFCRLRREFRTFRIDRLRGLRPLDEFFNRKSDITPKTYFEGSWQLFDGEPVDVSARFTGNSARVVLFGQHHPDEDVSECEDGSVLYRVRVKGLQEIQRWLLGFGGEVEIIEPDELRSSIADAGRHLYETHTMAKSHGRRSRRSRRSASADGPQTK